MEQSVDSNSFKKFTEMASLPIAYFAHISDLKKKRLSSKSGHRNLVVIASVVQAELSKLNFSFIYI